MGRLLDMIVHEIPDFKRRFEAARARIIGERELRERADLDHTALQDFTFALLRAGEQMLAEICKTPAQPLTMP